MTRTISLITAIAVTALFAVSAAWGQTLPDAFERTAGASTGATSQDAFERAATAAPGSTAPSSDAVLRAVANRSGLATGAAIGDHHERGTLAITAPVAPLSASSSDSDVAWSQIGIGLALGLVIALGLVLAMRVARPRELVH